MWHVVPALLDGVAQRAQPVVGRLPGGVGLPAVPGPCSPAAGYEPRNFTPGQLGVQVAQAVGDDLVGEVARRGR